MLTYRIDASPRLVMIKGVGALSADEISTNQVAMATAPGFDPTYALLVDLVMVSLAKIEPPDTRRHAVQSPFGPTSPRAVVVGHDAERSMVRMLSAYSELYDHSPMRDFADMASALAWIDSVRAADTGIVLSNCNLDFGKMFLQMGLQQPH